MSVIIDDKCPHCIPFILNHLAENPMKIPFIVALNGIQGAGKTTLVNNLQKTLSKTYNLPTLAFSIDDFYLPYTSQVALARSHPDNPLVQHRGQPGTHDVKLLKEVFDKLNREEEVMIPKYDKGAFGGKGDRAPMESWKVVNKPNDPPIRVIIFEGWCVGFRTLEPHIIRAIHETALTTSLIPSQSIYKTLQHHSLESLQFVNRCLWEYEAVTDLYDVLIHIDAEDLKWVYEWREEQEEVLRRERGVEGAMTREEVGRFVDGYFPAYELYGRGFKEGIFKGVDWRGRLLKLVVGRDRKVKEVITL